MSKIDEAEKFLNKIKIQILMKNTFFSTIMLSLKISITESVETARTDGITLYFNPEYLLGLTIEESVGLMLHELEHVALQHMIRKEGKNHKKWNYATDYAINNELHNSGYKLPEGGLIDHDLDDIAAEKIYKIIPDPDENKKTPGIGDDLTTPKDPAQVSQQIKQTVVQAKQASQRNPKPGEHIPDSIKREIELITNPAVPWQILLQNYMNDHIKEGESWKRPNRRFAPDMYLPTNQSPSIKNLTVAIDTSCSITDENFNTCMSEIEYVRSVFDLDRLRLICTDTKVRSDIEISQGSSLLDQEMRGGGYTDFRNIFKKLKNDKPTILIFFTDMEVYFNFPIPGFKVLWINIYNDQKAPEEYGKTINIKLNGDE